MRKIKRVKRRKASVAGVGATFFCVAVWGNGAAANENGGFWPRLGANGASSAEFDDNAGFADAAKFDGANDSATEEPGRVESANFAGYSVGSDLLERANAAVGRTWLVGWAEPDAATANAVPALEKSAANEPIAPIKTSSENGETAALGENRENGGTASVKTPILRDEKTASARGGGSLGSALVSTFGALAVVLGAFFALVAFLKRTGPKCGDGGSLAVVDSLTVGDKARLLTIRWGNRLILAAKTPENFTSLAEIADAEEANAMLTEIERRKEAASTGDVGAKAAAIWKRGRDAASVWRTAFETKGRRR